MFKVLKKFIKFAGKTIKLLRGGDNIMAVGTNISWKKGKQYYLSVNLGLFVTKIKWGRGQKFFGRKYYVKKWEGEQYKVFYAPLDRTPFS